MKTYVIFVVALCIAGAMAKKEHKKIKMDLKKEIFDLNKDKREIPVSPYSHGEPPRSSHLLHLQPGGGSSLNIGAGYSLGGSKSPSFSYSSPIHGSHFPSINSLSHNPFGHSNTKTRYTSISGNLHNPNAHYSTPKFQHTPQISHGSFGHSKPQISYGIPQYAPFAKPEKTYGSPSFTYSMPGLSHSPSLPSYASGTHGLGAYATSGSHLGISGPLFTPASTHDVPSVTYGMPHGGGSSGGHSLFSGNGFGQGFSGKKAFGGFVNSHSKPVFDLSSFGGSNKKAFRPSVYLGSSSELLGNGHSTSPSFGSPSPSHASILSSSPVYIGPKGVISSGHSSFDSLNSLAASQGDGFHGSTSLTGNFEIPSAGHAASSLSFGPLTGGYNYPSPAFSHDSDSGFSGFGSSHNIGHDSSLSGFDSSIGSHSFASPAPTYGTPVDDGPTLNFNLIGSGKQELPSSSSGHSFANLGHGSSSISSSFSVSDHGLGSASSPHKLYGSPKSSYSSPSPVYSGSEDNFGVHSESRYDTIKYSADYDEKDVAKQ